MSLIRVAIPLVLGLLELLWGAVRRRTVYRMADSLAAFGCAAMRQVAGLAVTAVTVGGYALVAEALRPGGGGVMGPRWRAAASSSGVDAILEAP